MQTMYPNTSRKTVKCVGTTIHPGYPIHFKLKITQAVYGSNFEDQRFFDFCKYSSLSIISFIKPNNQLKLFSVFEDPGNIQ